MGSLFRRPLQTHMLEFLFQPPPGLHFAWPADTCQLLLRGYPSARGFPAHPMFRCAKPVLHPPLPCPPLPYQRGDVVCLNSRDWSISALPLTAIRHTMHPTLTPPPAGGGPTVTMQLLQAAPGQAPWAKARGPGTLHCTPSPGLAPGRTPVTLSQAGTQVSK